MKRTFFVAVAIVLLAATAYALSMGQPSAQAQPNDDGFSDMDAAQKNPPGVNLINALQKLIRYKDVQNYRAEMQKDPFSYDPYDMSAHYYDILGPNVMLDVLEEDPHCHLKSHNLGRLIYINSGRDLTKALSIAGSRCTYGAFHGILAQVLDDSTGTTTDKHITDDAFVKTALSFCDRAEVKAKANEGTCVHSIGHAFMLLDDNDLGETLKRCEIFPSEIRQYYCATGVFMQREKTSGQEDASSQRFPCDTYGDPAACYRYKLRDVFPTNNFKAAKNLCDSLAKGAERNGCYHGLGFTYYLVILKNPRLLTDMCSSDDETDRRMCVEGMAGRLEIYYNRKSVLPVCETQPVDIKGWCERALYAGSGFGINDTSDNINSYYQPKALPQ